jgi:putative inorganic carbon (HCO3(-)) transporter
VVSAADPLAHADSEPQTGDVKAWIAEAGWAVLLVAAFAGYYLAPGLPLSVGFLAICAILCYLQLPLAVSLVPLAMPFFMLPKHLGHPHPEFSLGETAIVLCVVVGGARLALIQGRKQHTAEALQHVLGSRGLLAGITLFLVSASFATLFAWDRHLALAACRLVIVEPIAYAILVICLVRDSWSMLRTLAALVASGLCVAAIGLGQYLFNPSSLVGYAVGAGQHAHLVAAVYGSPDNLALLLDRALPVAVVLGLAWHTGVSRSIRGMRHAYYPVFLAISLLAMVLILTGSRGGMITAAAVSLTVVLLWYRRSPLSRPLAYLGLLLVLAGTAAVLWKFHHGLSTVTRTYVWQSALQMLRDHPLWGIGPDNFLAYYFNPVTGIDHVHAQAVSCLPPGVRVAPTHYMLAQAWPEPCLSHPHNVVLDLWLSTGLFGLIGMGISLVAVSHRARALLRVRSSMAQQAVTVSCIAIIVATLAHGLIDNSIFVPDIAVAFWLALALLVGQYAYLRRCSYPPTCYHEGQLDRGK